MLVHVTRQCWYMSHVNVGTWLHVNIDTCHTSMLVPVTRQCWYMVTRQCWYMLTRQCWYMLTRQCRYTKQFILN